MKLLHTGEIQQWDQFTIKNEPITSLELMERAAATCSHWLMQHYTDQVRFLIFCGTGNNGGDGLAIARHLDKARYRVEVFVIEGKQRSHDFKHELRSWEMQLGQKVNLLKGNDFPEITKDDIVVDALYGTGFKGVLSGVAVQLVNYLNQSAAQVISVDVPSGLNCDVIKQPDGAAIVCASATLTFQVPKYAFLFPENGNYTGFVHVLSIGLHPAFKTDGIPHTFYTDLNAAQLLHRPRKKFSHKGNFGHAWLIAGSKGKIGAALLAARACLRSGTGLLTAHIPSGTSSLFHQVVPEAMTEEENSDCFTVFNEKNMISCTAIGAGPGLGTQEVTQKALLKLLQTATQPLVLDADALNIIAGAWATGDAVKLPEGTILTPHPKEFERLAGVSSGSEERIKLLRKFATSHKVIVVLKGANTVVADTEGNIYFNASGNASLAKGGSGDVLCGIILGLIASGYPPVHAALVGVFVHGLAADLCIEHMGVETVLASDIIETLPKAFRLISLRNRKDS
ncbi:MAG: NAD(P)H-hydrate dehydratase [Bacteroidia bacterium]|nr:NAD(P)H-hydrate dehydratase [Bacteroidia bacterium]